MGQQLVLSDIEFAASSEPDHVATPVVPSAEQKTPDLVPVAPTGLRHLQEEKERQLNLRLYLSWLLFFLNKLILLSCLDCLLK